MDKNHNPSKRLTNTETQRHFANSPIIKYFCIAFLISYFFSPRYGSATDLVSFAPSCQSQIINRVDDISRDYTYLEFSRNSQSCHLKGIIGGEHQTFIKVLSFSGDKYSITFIPKQGEAYFSITGDGINILNSKVNNEKIITVKAAESVFSIEPYAHPYGEYEMIIQKIIKTKKRH